jgi:hypothetical protein
MHEDREPHPSHRPDNPGAKGKVGDKTSIHHIDMEQLHPGIACGNGGGKEPSVVSAQE